MMRSQHMLGGATAWLATTAVLPVPPTVALAGVPVAAYVSLWPDIDSEQSTAARWLGPVTYRFALYVKKRMGGHRYGMHSLLVGVPLCAAVATVLAFVVGVAVVASTGVSAAVLWPLTGTVFAASLVGAASHPLLDMLTCNCGHCAPSPRRTELYELRHVNRSGHRLPGVALLWPASRRRWGVPIMPVGGVGERIIARPLLLGLAGVGAVFTVMGWS